MTFRFQFGYGLVHFAFGVRLSEAVPSVSLGLFTQDLSGAQVIRSPSLLLAHFIFEFLFVSRSLFPSESLFHAFCHSQTSNLPHLFDFTL